MPVIVLDGVTSGPVALENTGAVDVTELGIVPNPVEPPNWDEGNIADDAGGLPAELARLSSPTEG